MRNAVLAIIAACSLSLAGCANMTGAQKQAVGQDVLLGLQIVAAGVAGMPGNDPMVDYWSKYAAGVLGQVAANPTPAQ